MYITCRRCRLVVVLVAVCSHCSCVIRVVDDDHEAANLLVSRVDSVIRSIARCVAHSVRGVLIRSDLDEVLNLLPLHAIEDTDEAVSIIPSCLRWRCVNRLARLG